MSTTKTSTARFKVGDWVTFQYGVERVFAQIIEDRGPLGYKGQRVYRIRLDRTFAEPDLFELSEHLLEAAPPPSKAAILNYLKEGGLVTIFQANLCNGKDVPRVWLTFTPQGEVTHTSSPQRGVLGDAAVPYFALIEDKVYTAKLEQVLDFLASFDLNRDEAREVVEAVGMAPAYSAR